MNKFTHTPLEQYISNKLTADKLQTAGLVHINPRVTKEGRIVPLARLKSTEAVKPRGKSKYTNMIGEISEDGKQ